VQIKAFPTSPRPEWRRPVAAVGNFDGLHRGHQKLIEHIGRRAADTGGTAVAVTFDPHPARVLRPDRPVPLLMTLEQKLEGIERAGAAAAAVVHFTPELARWEPEAFVEAVLIDWLGVSEVWVGENFLFGRNRSGTFTLLKALGEDRGFRTGRIEPVRYKDFVVSSTRIRHLVAEGRVDEAAAMLGHHYFIDGTVVRGDGRGRALGFPTANLETTNELVPAAGIYATLARVAGVQHPSVTSVGVRPMIGDGKATIEAHLFVPPVGRGPGAPAIDLYGQRLRLSFVNWLREQRTFESLEALSAQMADDCRRATGVFAKVAD
jgi:riboflavin kinase/FMN adenylyltransferase